MLLDIGSSISLRRDIYPTWQEASYAVKQLFIRGIEDYARKHAQDPRLPEDPRNEYKDFPGWSIFINRTNRPLYPTLGQVKEAAIRLGVNSRGTYEKRYKMDPLLPSDPRIYPDFEGWDPLFEKNKYPTCAEAKAAAGKLALDKSLGPYRAYRKAFSQDPRLPHRPDKHYPDFPGYADFLGVPKVKPGRKPKISNPYPSWQEASSAVALLDIYSREEYLLRFGADPRLPKDPETEYRDFPGWVLFLW